MSAMVVTRRFLTARLLTKYTYNAHFADRKYHQILKGLQKRHKHYKARITSKDRIISPLIEQGQSPYQIAVNHPELGMSVRTIYTPTLIRDYSLPETLI